MTDAYDLTSRPWIPCERLDGTVAELSTRDALAQAHELHAIVDPSPLVVPVLHRHLLAVLHRTYDGPRSMDEWLAITGAGRFDAGRLDRYLDEVHSRMDLFHPDRPFAQTRGLVAQFEVSPIDELDLPRSKWGGARELFQHRSAGARPTMTAAAAARALLAHHAFATGGLIKKPGEPDSATAAPLTKSAIVLLRGASLFRTLVSNLLIYDPSGNQPVVATPDDRPTWESDPPPTRLPLRMEPEHTPTGWLEMLTWLSRRIELVREDDRVVGFVRAVWHGLAESSPQDPMVLHRVDKKRGYVPVSLNPRRAFWRDAHALFAATRGESSFLLPRALGQVTQRPARALLGDTSLYMVEFAGQSSFQSSVDAAGREGIPVAIRELDDPDMESAVRAAVQLAENGVNALRVALWSYAAQLLAPGDRRPATKDVADLVSSLGAESAAWHEIGGTFNTFMAALTHERPDRARLRYATHVPRIIRRRFEVATALCTASGAGLQARALGERRLNAELARLGVTTPSISDTAR